MAGNTHSGLVLPTSIRIQKMPPQTFPLTSLIGEAPQLRVFLGGSNLCQVDKNSLSYLLTS